MESARYTGSSGRMREGSSSRDLLKPNDNNPSDREAKPDKQILLFKKPRRR